MVSLVVGRFIGPSEGKALKRPSHQVQHLKKLRVCVLVHAAGTLGNDTWLVFLPLAPLKTTAASLLILAFGTVMLGIVALLMLGHLLAFHFYLCRTLLEDV